jgi:hypothetical protein
MAVQWFLLVGAAEWFAISRNETLHAANQRQPDRFPASEGFRLFALTSESIQEVGVLHSVVVSSEGRLIAGQRPPSAGSLSGSKFR